MSGNLAACSEPNLEFLWCFQTPSGSRFGPSRQPDLASAAAAPLPADSDADKAPCDEEEVSEPEQDEDEVRGLLP